MTQRGLLIRKRSELSAEPLNFTLNGSCGEERGVLKSTPRVGVGVSTLSSILCIYSLETDYRGSDELLSLLDKSGIDLLRAASHHCD